MAVRFKTRPIPISLSSFSAFVRPIYLLYHMDTSAPPKGFEVFFEELPEQCFLLERTGKSGPNGFVTFRANSGEKGLMVFTDRESGEWFARLKKYKSYRLLLVKFEDARRQAKESEPVGKLAITCLWIVDQSKNSLRQHIIM